MNLKQAGQIFSLWVAQGQNRAIVDALAGEEGEYFKEKIIKVATVIDTMPVTYEQDGKGDDAIVHLHYFSAGSDWWITEKDMTGDGRQQAFGFACLDGMVHFAEFGYISIAELVENGVSLDLYWEPVTIGSVRRALEAV